MYVIMCKGTCNLVSYTQMYDNAPEWDYVQYRKKKNSGQILNDMNFLQMKSIYTLIDKLNKGYMEVVSLVPTGNTEKEFININAVCNINVI